jgi:hypothetical protein
MKLTQYFLYHPLVKWRCRAHEDVVLDSELLPDLLEFNGEEIDMRLWFERLRSRRLLDLLAVLVYTRQEDRFSIEKAPVTREDVGNNRRVSGTKVWEIVDVVNRGRDIHRLRSC